MLRVERRIDETIQSRWLSILMAMLSVVATLVAAGAGDVVAIPGMRGLGLTSANHWIDSDSTSLYTALAVYLPTALAIVVINRYYNLLHTLSLICGSFFLWMLGACPMAMGQFYGGTVLLVVLLAAMALLFSVFDEPAMTPRVFMAFFLIGVGALTDYGFLAYLPIMIVGCGQMRVFNFRTMLAALTGLLTPLWMAWGFGLIDFSHFEAPVFDNIFETFTPGRMVWFLSLVGFTAALLVTLIVVNLIRIYSYNLITRARNGILILASITTALMMVLDYTNLPFYYPTLCCCTAFQLGHFAHFHIGRRSGYIVPAAAIIIYAGFYLWRLII
ncbi:MAG: hypothetical protein J1E63_09225 [Muribaculaceae bacterium]|nr:hypothetical protein [Muribaculaceae bacterium]